MKDINISTGYYHYCVEFNDVAFKIDAELYLNADNIPEAIEEAFEGDFLDVSELETVTFIDITNYSEDVFSGMPGI
jgi:hypothetical protein